jgi:hypothetical protein
VKVIAHQRIAVTGNSEDLCELHNSIFYPLSTVLKRAACASIVAAQEGAAHAT